MMWRPALAVALGVALAGAVLAHTVFAQHPPASRPGQSHGRDSRAEHETIPGGVRLTVVAKSPDDAKLVTRIRGRGLAGLITEGAHHQPHHLAMAKGEALAGHTR